VTAVNGDILLNVMPCACSQTEDQITCYLSYLTCYIAAVGKVY